MKPVHTGSRPVAKNGDGGITGPVENSVEHRYFGGVEGSQYVTDHITSASRTPDADAQAGKRSAAHGIHD